MTTPERDNGKGQEGQRDEERKWNREFMKQMLFHPVPYAPLGGDHTQATETGSRAIIQFHWPEQPLDKMAASAVTRRMGLAPPAPRRTHGSAQTRAAGRKERSWRGGGGGATDT